MRSSPGKPTQNVVKPGLRDLAPDQEAGSRNGTLVVLSWVALLALAAYCALGAVTIGVAGARLIPNDTDNTYPESANIYSAITAARTGHLYASPSQPPYVLQPFGPLYYATTAAIARLSHLDFDLVRMRVRMLTYGCFLLSSALIFLICRAARFSAGSATLAALWFLGQPYFLFWNATVRPDMLFLMTMLLSLYLVIEAENTPNMAAYVVSGIFGGMAILIKQPAIAGPIAVFGILLYRRKVRPAAAFVLGTILPVVLVFGFLLWHRGPFIEQFTSVGKSFWSVRDGYAFALDQLKSTTMLVPIGIGVIGLVQALRVGGTAPQIIAAFAIVNWAIGFSGLPQIGSDVNYFLPGLAGCALLLPFALMTMRRNVPSKVYIAISYLATIIWIFFSMLPAHIKDVSWAFSGALQPANRSYAALEPFKILSDRPVFTVHGRDPDLLDPFTSHNLELAGHWDSSPIIENIRRGDYDLIILAASGHWHVIGNFRDVSFFSRTLVNAVNEKYRVLCSTSGAAVLQPREREVGILPAALGEALGHPCGLDQRDNDPELVVPPHVR